MKIFPYGRFSDLAQELLVSMYNHLVQFLVTWDLHLHCCDGKGYYLLDKKRTKADR